MRYSIWQTVVLMSVLLPSSLTDVKQKSVPWWIIVPGIILSLACSVIFGGFLFTKLLTSLIPGIVLLGISVGIKDSIGMADALLSMIIGITTGLKYAICILLAAFMLAALVSLILIVVKKAGRKKKIPFVPFLSAGTILCFFI